MATSMVLDAIEQAIWTRQQEGVLDSSTLSTIRIGDCAHVDPFSEHCRSGILPSVERTAL